MIWARYLPSRCVRILLGSLPRKYRSCLRSRRLRSAPRSRTCMVAEVYHATELLHVSYRCRSTPRPDLVEQSKRRCRFPDFPDPPRSDSHATIFDNSVSLSILLSQLRMAMVFTNHRCLRYVQPACFKQNSGWGSKSLSYRYHPERGEFTFVDTA